VRHAKKRSQTCMTIYPRSCKHRGELHTKHRWYADRAQLQTVSFGRRVGRAGSGPHEGARPVQRHGAARQQLDVCGLALALDHGRHRKRAGQVAEGHQHEHRRQHLRAPGWLGSRLSLGLGCAARRPACLTSPGARSSGWPLRLSTGAACLKQPLVLTGRPMPKQRAHACRDGLSDAQRTASAGTTERVARLQHAVLGKRLGGGERQRVRARGEARAAGAATRGHGAQGLVQAGHQRGQRVRGRGIVQQHHRRIPARCIIIFFSGQSFGLGRAQ